MHPLIHLWTTSPTRRKLVARRPASTREEGEEMKNPTTLRILFVCAVLVAGWTAGRAQTSGPDFEFVVTTTATETGMKTSVECVRGCKLSWVERGMNPRAAQLNDFNVSCSGTTQCASGFIGGWIQK